MEISNYTVYADTSQVISSGTIYRPSLNVKIKLTENGVMPSYGTLDSAGMDICVAEDVVLNPGEMKLVHTNFSTEIPIGYVALVFARSGLSTKHRIALANSVAVIDSDYRGEWKIPLVNENPVKNKIMTKIKSALNTLLKKPVFKTNIFEIKTGERIAQFIVIPYPHVVLTQIDELSDSDRGTGGFGSTGK